MQGISAKGLYYAIDMDYDNGNINIKNIDVVFSNEDLANVVNERYFKTYSLKIIDDNGRKEVILFGILNKLFYDVALENYDELVSGGMQEFDNV